MRPRDQARCPQEPPTGWRIVFFGTPDFAVPSLQALLEAGEQVVGVVTQPDKPAGRGRRTTAPPVKQYCAKFGLPVIQPERIRNNVEFVAQLRQWAPDLIVVVAYGKILPPDILALPPYGCINVHASLLPRYRGAAPIQWALIRGETQTGISVMQMTEEMDAGPVLLQCPLDIEPEETYGELEQRLAELGATCLLQALRAWHAGRIQAQPQDVAQVTFAPAITKDMGRIDWSRSAEEVARWVRGLSPSPGAFFTWKEKRVKVYRARAHEQSAVSSVSPPGTVVSVEPALLVACGRGVLELVEIQLEGRRRASGSEVARGLRWRPGQPLA